MKLNELSHNKIALEATLKLFNKLEETDDGYITWFDKKEMPHLQVNIYNQTVYILTDHFKNILYTYEKFEERKKEKKFDPFYLDPKVRQVELGERIKEKKNYSKENIKVEEKPQKSKSRLAFRDRVNVDCIIDTSECLTEHERDILKNKESRSYISYEHLLSEDKPEYIDKYTTAYNSEIMRAILSHQ